MAWIKLESRYPRHPKVLRVSRGARLFNIEAWCYCGEYLTDGVVTESALAGIGPDVSLKDARRYAQELEAAGLWDRRPDGGWTIHGYLERNPSKAEAEELSRQNAEAGRLGGLKSGQARRKRKESDAGSGHEAPRFPSASSEREANAKRHSTPSSSSSPSSSSPSSPFPLDGSPQTSVQAPAKGTPRVPVGRPSRDGVADSPPVGVSRGVWLRLRAECDALGVEPEARYAEVDLTVRGDLLNRKASGDPEVTPAYVRAAFERNLAMRGRDGLEIRAAAVAGAAAEDGRP